MPEELRFDGRVAVVTGAGAGLGKAYALLLASRGATVVVNDLGGGRHGDGSSTNAADAVVNEIRAAGGKAVGNYDSVENGENIIKTAIENFGRVDIVINNAGILRDKSFARISDTDWDLIHRVHLKGSFKTTQAAWPYFKKQNYGRIIMTSSNSGLYGNFGQANYSAAKLGLVGLSNTIAIEGSKNNIHCNVIVPTAASRLTEDILPPDFFAELRPELIAPVVAYLCHESCDDNGSVIEAAAGWAGKNHIVRSKGGLLRSRIGDQVSIEDVKNKWGIVTDMSTARRLESIGEASGTLLGVLEEMKQNQETGAGGEDEVVDTLTFSTKEAILYALGVGSSVTEETDLRFLYENHQDFATLPTFLIIPGQMAFMMSGTERIKVPGKVVNPAKVLHGEQYLEVLKPIPTSGTLTSKCRVVDVLDKDKGAVAIVNMDTFDEQGEKIAFAQMTVFAVGAGGFGGPRNSSKAVSTIEPPKRKPDFTIKQKTTQDQAALYRLSGDLNPLHIDPSMAAFGGFAQPILHGLCSLGFSSRHVLLQYGGNDPANFKAIKVRFSKPVLPGQTLQTDMWREGNRIHFQTSVVENKNVVISGAYVDLHNVVLRIAPSNVSATELVLNTVSSDALQSDEVFEGIKKQVATDPATAKNVNAVFQYNITKNGKQAATWTLDLKKGDVYKGTLQGGGKPDTVFTLSDEDFVELSQGKLNPQVAFMKGKLKITGNIMLAEKMRGLLNQRSKL